MICDKKDCTGCGMCKAICPKHAIKMKEDIHGFKYPEIDSSKCVNCNLCSRNCPINNTKRNNNTNPLAYMAWSLNTEVLSESSSGGVFTELAKIILNKGGCIVGSQLNENFICEHIIINEENELNKLRGSKYVQSDMEKVFQIVKEKLNNNKEVLFCGCPCQVAAIKNFIGKNDEKLYTIDLICHGVPSNKIFKDYIKELEKKYNKKVTGFNFRKNIKEWRKYFVEYTFDDNSKVQKLAIEDSYMACYLKCSIYRESCYNCKFNNFPRMGDITLGDYSGVDSNEATKSAIKNGISCCIINNNKGNILFEQVKEKIYYEKKDIEKIINSNRNIVQSSIKHPNRGKLLNSKKPLSISQKELCAYKKSSILINKIFNVNTQNIIRKVIGKK